MAKEKIYKTIQIKSVERIYSRQRLIEAEYKNKLTTETVTDVLFSKERVDKQGRCVNFTPFDSVLSAKI